MNNSELFDLTGKTAIVTGGGNGIGKASSCMLAKSGANVVVSDYKALADEINQDGGSAIAIDCDVTKDEALGSVLRRANFQLGQRTSSIRQWRR